LANTSTPLLGFNNNVRHRGRIFHIQTEDSGVKSPRIVTHLFADGGRIVKTLRTDYSEHVGREDMQPVVRRLMKEQHKGMFIALRAGELDALLEQVCGAHPEPPAPPPAPRSSASGPDSPISSPVAAPVPLPPPSSDAVPAGAASSDAPAAPRPRERTLSNPALRRVTPSVPPQAAETFDLAVGALEAATAPNAHLARNPDARRRTPPPIPRAGSAHGTHAVAGRYAASRPTAIFTNQVSPEKQSIFGENVISEQSLDEVILSYLADDLEAPPHK
jgi:hypothetical protein